MVPFLETRASRLVLTGIEWPFLTLGDSLADDR